MSTKAHLFIARKLTPDAHKGYADDMRAIETWANNLSTGGYASLTGPGETTTPGALTQLGDFDVTAFTGGRGKVTFTVTHADLILTGGTPPYVEMVARWGTLVLTAFRTYVHARSRGHTTTLLVTILAASTNTGNAEVNISAQSAGGTGAISITTESTGVHGTGIITVKTGLFHLTGGLTVTGAVAFTTTTGDITMTTDGAVRIVGATGDLHFFGTPTTVAVTKRTVTGSRGGVAALSSLLNALSQYGLINNTSTP